MPTRTFTVEGLTCQDCAVRVRAAVSQVEGVNDCQVDHAAGTLTISSTMPDLAVEQIDRAVSSAGYALVTETASSFRREGSSILGFVRFILSKRETAMTAVAGLLTMLGLALAVASAPSWSRTALFAAAIIPTDSLSHRARLCRVLRDGSAKGRGRRQRVAESACPLGAWLRTTAQAHPR